MTLPTSDAQSSRFPLNHQPEPVPTHSMAPALPLSTPQTPPPFTSNARLSNDMDYDRTIDFATHSWDLFADPTGVPRSYAFLLIIMVCLVLMLISGGVVLFVMLQP
ncbi:MAG: hypothetical protein E6I80_20870 [Chloroflexi bacterium]|nr:MAG: hypothetical protein E6I80_20870 [Chloroflexota bacterium]